MSASSHAALAPNTFVSPLMLADQLLTLAKDAERAGLHRPAERLLKLAYAVYGEKPSPV
jgi:hypothetical protein